MTTGLALDILIICFLTTVIGGCVLLNLRLKTFRREQGKFLTLIGRFDDTVQQAESNIARLHDLSSGIDEHLGEQISTAFALRDELRFLIERAAPVERAAPASERLMTKSATRGKAPVMPFATLPSDDASGSVVETGLLEALREARKG